MIAPPRHCYTLELTIPSQRLVKLTKIANQRADPPSLSSLVPGDCGLSFVDRFSLYDLQPNLTNRHAFAKLVPEATPEAVPHGLSDLSFCKSKVRGAVRCRHSDLHRLSVLVWRF